MEFLLIVFGCVVFTAFYLVKDVTKDVKRKGFKQRWTEVKEVENKKEQGVAFYQKVFKLIGKISTAIVVVITAILMAIGLVRKFIK